MPGPFDRSGRTETLPSAGFLLAAPAESRPTGLTYEPFYGLKEKPFSLTSDSRFFYQSRSHAPAFDDLLNAIRRRESLNVLTGDIGTGKTTLCRAVLQSLDRKTFSALVPDPFASREELLKVLLADFGVASIDDVTSGRLRGATRTELSYLLYEFLGTLAPLQAFAVVIIDEAQNLSQQLLEEVRILSDADGQLQVVLVGQLELRDRLKVSEMRQLHQRVSVHCQLQPLDLAGVAGYISHRLHVAGGSSDRVRFTGEAVEAIYLFSGGVPRVINRLCDRALRYGYSKRESTIDADIVESANPELDRELARGSAPSSSAQVCVPAVSAPPPVAVVAASPLAAPAPLPVAAVAMPPVAAMTMRPLVAPAVAALPINEGAVAATPERTATPTVAGARAQEPARMIAPSPLPGAMPEPAAPPTATDQTGPFEAWLRDIDKQPLIDLDWRQRWAPTNAVAASSPPPSRSGVTLRIPAGATPHRNASDRGRPRWARWFAAGAVALILLSGALAIRRPSIAAALEVVLQSDDQLTPLPWPARPPSPRRVVGAPVQQAAAGDPLDSAGLSSGASATSPRR